MPPDYVRPLGDPVFAPPYYFGTQQRPWLGCGLRLPVTRTRPKRKSRLHELCRKYLEEPLQGSVRFEPINEFIWVNLNDYQQAGLAAAPDTGWLRYLEVTFQFAVKLIDPNQEDQRNPEGELRWLVAALFLDGTDETGGLRCAVLPILAGREVSGLPKTVGRIEWVRRSFVDLAEARLWALDPPRAGGDSLALHELMKITIDDQMPPGAAPPDKSITAHLLGIRENEIIIPDKGNPDIGFVSRFNLRVDLAEVYGGRLLGLKQFHDAVDFDTAVYQAVVETSFRTLEVDFTPYLVKDHLVHFFPTATYDLPAFFGLEVDAHGAVAVPDNHGFFLQASALFGEADRTRVWRAPDSG